MKKYQGNSVITSMVAGTHRGGPIGLAHLSSVRVAHSCSSTTISKGGAWGRVSYGLYKTPAKFTPRRALLAAPKGERQTSEQRPVELPRLARPKGCFAAYYARSIDELPGRTTGRLGYDRPDSAYAIGGTAELAL